MHATIPAVFDSGVFRPLEPVDLPNGTPVEVQPLAQSAAEPSSPSGWPDDYFEQTAGALAGEEFERPPQGELPVREDW